MIQLEDTRISELILHRVTAAENRELTSNSNVDCSDEDEAAVLKKILLKPFLTHAQTFEFDHDVNIDYNILFQLSKSILEGDNFTEKSADIARHLIATSKHPHIKDGDLFIAKFDGIGLDNRQHEALGIYKFEDKENFIETSTDNHALRVSFRKGIGSKKPDKACLILFTDEPYTLLIIDSNPNETDYWQHDFIKHRPKNDDINRTNSLMTRTRNFITTQIPEDFEITKADQIDLLNRSMDYFKNHETFRKQEFGEEVFGNQSVIDSFWKFDQTHRDENGTDLPEDFDIAPQAVKKQARVFKSVLKLDKNFHIYIHGNRELIEQGTDERGRKYYKIFYEEER